jgi:DNA invertase Pin-like site-specific DNA recombinase
MDFSQLYDYDVFRESREEGPHADRHARVSTEEQSLDLQPDALKAAGCQRIFTDKVSATKAEHPGLADAISHLRHGDMLIIWKVDRANGEGTGRLRGRFRRAEDPVPQPDRQHLYHHPGQFFFHTMASLAQTEQELLAERTRAVFAAARRPGRVGSVAASGR